MAYAASLGCRGWPKEVRVRIGARGALVGTLVATLGLPLGDVAAKQYAIIKADDFVYETGSPTKTVSEPWRKFIELIKQKHVVAGLGLISKHLDRGAPEFVAYAKQLALSGTFELWNHGYEHIYGVTDAAGKLLYAEFYNKPYDYQLNQLRLAQEAAKAKLGITMRTFGAPGNRVDQTTSKVIAANGEIKVWLYAAAQITMPPGVIRIGPTSLEWNVAGGGRVIDVERFIREYDPAKEVICFQLHPRSKSDDDLKKIGAAIDFLLSKGVQFILPYDYYLLKTGGQSTRRCGNGIVEAPETCDPPSSCPASCDDGDRCTEDSTRGSAASCNLECAHQAIRSCVHNDGCCPVGCDSTRDSDCIAPKDAGGRDAAGADAARDSEPAIDSGSLPDGSGIGADWAEGGAVGQPPSMDNRPDRAAIARDGGIDAPARPASPIDSGPWAGAVEGGSARSLQSGCALYDARGVWTEGSFSLIVLLFIAAIARRLRARRLGAESQAMDC